MLEKEKRLKTIFAIAVALLILLKFYFLYAIYPDLDGEITAKRAEIKDYQTKIELVSTFKDKYGDDEDFLAAVQKENSYQASVFQADLLPLIQGLSEQSKVSIKGLARADEGIKVEVVGDFFTVQKFVNLLDDNFLNIQEFEIKRLTPYNLSGRFVILPRTEKNQLPN